MKSNIFIIVSVLLTLVFATAPERTFGAAMTDYCQAPPYINATVPPNVMLAVDISGSMGWSAYKTVGGERSGRCSLDQSRECNDDHDCAKHGVCVQPTTYKFGTCSNDKSIACDIDADCGAGNTCVPNMVYEGYFIPDKTYSKDADDGIYYEHAGPVCVTKCVSYNPCQAASAGSHCIKNENGCKGSKPWACCNKYQTTCTSPETGNKLNFDNMARIDLVRWAMTGGSPATCDVDTYTTYTENDCDPRMYNTATGKTKVGTVCNDTLDVNKDGIPDGGCILLANNGVKVAVPWSRVYDGLVHQFQNLVPRPRMGAMFFGGTTVKSNYVYVGDFTAANSRTPYPFQNLLTEVNATNPTGFTPTGPAMWDVFNYFKQTNPEYGGIPPQSGSGDKWKNPMFDCPDKGGGNCMSYKCAKNFVLLMSDGLWNRGGGPPATASCDINTGFTMHSADPVVPAYLMHQGFTNVATDVKTNVTEIYTVGLFLGLEGAQALKNISMYGSFDSTGTDDFPANLTDYPKTTCTIKDVGALCATGTGSQCTPLPPSSSDWDKDPVDGIPDTYLAANDAIEIKNKIMDAILKMLTRVASGTAASVLASGEGSGANLVQAVFYPRHSFGPGEPDIYWTSTLQNLWYYLDPRTSNSSIRENTYDPGATPQLNLNKDRILNFWFDPGSQTTMAKLYADNNGDGYKDSTTPLATINAENLHYLWEAGLELWKKDPAMRRIFTNVNGSAAMIEFKTANLTSTVPTLQSLLNTDLATRTPAGNTTVAQNIVRYIRGEDLAPVTVDGVTIEYRNRTTKIDLNKDGDFLDTGETAKIWKLGDIINATPRLSSWIPLHNYHLSYGDSTYEKFINSATYKNRGTVYSGANDGMLHAFNLGKLTISNDPYLKATLETPASGQIGEENWAFIPKNVLPYLQYYADPDYCHLYYIDLTPTVIDASIGETGCVHNPAADPMDTNEYWNCPKSKDTWRTVLIGGMRLGGSCKDVLSTSTEGVKAPGPDKGYSSYFALDVTDPTNPVFMWEFDNTKIPAAELLSGGLGFATTGPAVLKISSRKLPASATTSSAVKSRNGRWFVVFASGPTGPIDPTLSQFKAHSDQPLKLFILDLKTGALLRTINTGIKNAFGGSLNNAMVDYDMDYQDDALYLGYTRAENDPPTAMTKWINGGIIRLLTHEDLKGTNYASTALDPNNWTVSTFMDGLGPVTSSIGHIAHYPTNSSRPDFAYVYAGTGRYFFNSATETDDAVTQRHIYGLQEPCLAEILQNETCTATVATPVSADMAGLSSAGNWYISLDAASGTTLFAERMITDPLATPMGAVFFTTFAPSADVCSFGGKSYLWAVKYDTGGSVASSLAGVGLMQVSTGAIEEIKLESAFTEKGARRTTGLDGVPPTGQGLSLVMPPKPSKKIIHMKRN